MKEQQEVTALGQFLRHLRIDRGEYQEEMGEKLGVSAQYLSRIELGRRKASTKFVNNVASVYNLNKKECKELNKAVYLSYPEIILTFSRPITSYQMDVISTLQQNLPALDESKCFQLMSIIETEA